MFRILIARVLLHFDVKYRFISVSYIQSYLGITNSRKQIKTTFTQKGNLSVAPKAAPKVPSLREYYALVLFWSGIPPHPKFETTSKLPNSFSTKTKIGFYFFRFLLHVLGRINPPITKVGSQPIREGLPINHLVDLPFPQRESNVDVRNISIIVPVYNAYEYLIRCLESVFATTKGIDILIVDDASTDPRINLLLTPLRDAGKIRLIKNQSNLGFVRTANLGMQNCGRNDVILLNSDTVVFEGWLEGLCIWKHSKNKIASVTAMSNAATIFSVPFDQEFDCSSEITGYMAASLRNFNNTELPIYAPTCHGFCVLLPRTALDAVGYFDDAVFGQGYGEENDYSQRAINLGFHNVIATNVVVHHYGSKSFDKTKEELSSKNIGKLLDLHPSYLSQIDEFLGKNLLDLVRLRAIAALNHSAAIQLDVHITHALKGGVLSSINFESAGAERIRLIIEPVSESLLKLDFKLNHLQLSLRINTDLNLDTFPIIFGFLKIKEITIQHLLGYSEEMKRSLADSTVSKSLRLHDFFYVCPKIHLMGQTYSDCALPNTATCNTCLGADSGTDIETWRLQQSVLLNSVDSISAPSADTARRYNSIFPNIEISKMQFDVLRNPIPFQTKSHPETIVLGVIGNLTLHKGFDFFSELVRVKSKFKLQFEVYGELGAGLISPGRNVRLHGHYESFDELSERIRVTNPDLFLFPGKIPETYSYALSEALVFEKPIAYFNIGAIAERMTASQYGVPLNLVDQPGEVISKILVALGKISLEEM